MNHNTENIKSMIEVNEKSVSAFLMYVSLMKPNDVFVTPVGKVKKLVDDCFEIVIDEDVIDKASSIILGDEFDFTG